MGHGDSSKDQHICSLGGKPRLDPGTNTTWFIEQPPSSESEIVPEHQKQKTDMPKSKKAKADKLNHIISTLH